MAIQVCMSGMMVCSFGVAPVPITVLPINRVLNAPGPSANIMDNKPMLNIAPFGTCSSLANPVVAAATAAALGALTPMPCIPATMSPWVIGAPTVLIGNMPALNNTAKLICSWGGVITITFPGQVTVMIP